MINIFQWNASQDTFCIEIKPKQGWTLRKCDPIPFPGIEFQDINKCRYCAMQYWKVISITNTKQKHKYTNCVVDEGRRDPEN